MFNIELVDVVRVLVLLFSFIGMLYSIDALRTRLRDIAPADYPRLTRAQAVAAGRAVSREIERIAKFMFFILAAGANIGRAYVTHDGAVSVLGSMVLLSLLAVNFLMMLGTLRDKREMNEITEIIKERRERERDDNPKESLEWNRGYDAGTGDTVRQKE